MAPPLRSCTRKDPLKRSRERLFNMGEGRDSRRRYDSEVRLLLHKLTTAGACVKRRPASLLQSVDCAVLCCAVACAVLCCPYQCCATCVLSCPMLQLYAMLTPCYAVVLCYATLRYATLAAR